MSEYLNDKLYERITLRSSTIWIRLQWDWILFWKVGKSLLQEQAYCNICVERMEWSSCLPVLARSFFSIKLLIPVPRILSWTVEMRLQLIQQHYTIPCSLQLLAIFQSSSWNIQQSTLFNHLITQCTIYLGSSCSSWCSGSTLELGRNITFMSNFLCTYNKHHLNPNFMGLSSHL